MKNHSEHHTVTTLSTQINQSQFQSVISERQNQQIRSEIIKKYKKIILKFEVQSFKLLAVSESVRIINMSLELVTCFHVYRSCSCFFQFNFLSLFILLSAIS